jgi:hypothetical protein
MNIKIVGVSFLLNSLLIIYGQSASRPAFNTAFSQLSTNQVEPKVRTYGFLHMETTGITSYVIVNGKEKPILFRPDSDLLALKSFDALNSRIFLPNADGKKRS